MSRIDAIGGTSYTYSNGGTEYKVHVFSASSTFEILSGSGDVDYLIVGGGGGASYGGGGGGGVLQGSLTLSAGSYSVEVGAGGARPTCGTSANECSHGGNGGNSAALGLTAIGGGGGGNYGGTTYKPGFSGGSGGGGGLPSGTGGAGASGQGNAGSAGNSANCAGGGGGAGSAGAAPVYPAGGYGGSGIASSITGTEVYYGGGGGGTPANFANPGLGGLGGGGTSKRTGFEADAGIDGLGGGGGGGTNSAPFGNKGGSGVVILRYVNIPALYAEISIDSPFSDTTIRATNPSAARVSIASPFSDVYVHVAAQNYAYAAIDSPFSSIAARAAVPIFAYATIDSPFDQLLSTVEVENACVVTLDTFYFGDVSPVVILSSYHETARETVQFGSSAFCQPTYRLLDALTLTTATTPTLELSKTLSESISFSDAVTFIANVLLQEGLSFTDQVSGTTERLLLLAETLRMTTGVGTTLEIAKTLMEELAFQDVASFVASFTAEETLTFADALTAEIEATLRAQETLTLADAISSAFVMIASETLEVGATLASTLEVTLRARDGLVFIGSLPLEDGDYQAWVMNADTTGVTTYSNFPMDTLWVDPTDGKPYGLNSTGIYCLEGTDDDGEPINAVIATGDIEFETSREKNVPRAYLYITQGGDAILKTITSVRGSRHETYYELADRTTDGDDDNTYRRVPLGRGVRGIWWRFEIHNVDGSTIDLSGAEVLPVVLSRKG